MNKLTAKQILAGSQRIDEMKKEIHQVVSILIGYAQYDAKCYDVTGQFKHGALTWDVSLSKFCMIFAIRVTCTKHEVLYRLTSRDGSENIIPSIEDVQEVYESLDAFAVWLCEIAPGIKKKIEPIINASAV